MHGALNVKQRVNYGEAIRLGFEHLLSHYPKVFVMGQGLWSPWYVGTTMTDLDKKFGAERVIDTPVSELACTGAAVGASLCGYRPIVVHPRMDFILYALDAIVNQAAKWSSMFGGQAHPCVTVRAIINRGGEQGAQHSQALHAWFAHIPGLRVVMPATARDARDLLVASVLCDDPVIFIDDRWLYGDTEELDPIVETDLAKEGPRVLRQGSDITLVGCGYTTSVCRHVAEKLARVGVAAEVLDLRVLNPFQPDLIIESAERTRRVVVVDGGWSSCGMSAEVLATLAEHLSPGALLKPAKRVTLAASPAPTSHVLEEIYYPGEATVLRAATEQLN
jgi:pyruvate dehydrogenase E1 component beta subunit